MTKTQFTQLPASLRINLASIGITTEAGVLAMNFEDACRLSQLSETWEVETLSKYVAGVKQANQMLHELEVSRNLRPVVSRRDYFIGQTLMAIIDKSLSWDASEPECRELAKKQVLRAISYADMVIELTAEGEAHD